MWNRTPNLQPLTLKTYYGKFDPELSAGRRNKHVIRYTLTDFWGWLIQCVLIPLLGLLVTSGNVGNFTYIYIYIYIYIFISLRLCFTLIIHICSSLLSLFHSFSLCPLFRHQRISSTHVQDAVWQLMYWASVIAIMTILCCAPLVTCSTSILGSSWDTLRCLAASKGENLICCGGRVYVYAFV